MFVKVNFQGDWKIKMKVKVNKLKHHPLNSKIYNLSNIEDLVKSINDVGLLQKIIINKKENNNGKIKSNLSKKT